MKLNELNEGIAAACDMRAKSVLAVQKETFRQLRQTIENGQRVTVPGFGIFSIKEKPATEGGEAKKSVRFKLQAPADASGERKAKKQEKKAARAGSETERSSEDTGESPAPAAGGRKAKKAKKAKKLAKPGSEQQEDGAAGDGAAISTADE